MMKKAFFCLSISVLLFASCDHVTNPIEEGGTGPVDTTSILRKVLLEDFTGHYCTNCPEASLVADQLLQLYGEQLIVVGVHAGPDFFVEPQNNPDGSYATDFRTDAGNDYASTFNINFLPQGMVSRREFNGSLTLSDGSWGSATAAIIGEDAIMKIEFNSVQYDQGNNEISTQISVSSLEEITGDYNLTVYLIEDHITDWQLSSLANPPNVPDYDHRHVLRDNLNGTWGTTVFSGTVPAGQTETLDFNSFSVDPAWNMDNGYLIAYVYDDSTYEIFQVEQIEVDP